MKKINRLVTIDENILDRMRKLNTDISSTIEFLCKEYVETEEKRRMARINDENETPGIRNEADK